MSDFEEVTCDDKVQTVRHGGPVNGNKHVVYGIGSFPLLLRDLILSEVIKYSKKF